MDITDPLLIEFPKARLWTDQIPLFFHKSLKGSVNEVCYETATPTQFTNGDKQPAYIELNGFGMSELRDWLLMKYPNACSFFKSKKATLVITYGRMDWMSSEEELQTLQVHDEGDLFLTWRVEDIGFFNGILHNLAYYENLELKIDLDVSDEYFSKDNKNRNLNVPVAKLIAIFN